MVAQLEPKDLEKMGFYRFEKKSYGLFESIPAGLQKTGEQLAAYIKQFKLIFNFKTGAYKGIGGFASMTKIYSSDWDWYIFWERTAFLSLVLAFMNLLPIPGLDGGYVFFLLFEMVGIKVSEKTLERATGVGLVILLALMLWANGMDVFRWLKP
jgi:regulator of sigma E protease